MGKEDREKVHYTVEYRRCGWEVGGSVKMKGQAKITHVSEGIRVSRISRLSIGVGMHVGLDVKWEGTTMCRG